MGKKKKRILVANANLVGVGGSELYTFDLIKALTKIEHIETEYFTFHKGGISDRIERELGVRFMSKNKYDLILATHVTSVKELFGKGPIVQICHGTIIDLEFPCLFADYHVAVSEEISQSLIEKGYDNEIVLNGLDLEHKRPLTRPRENVKKVLSLCQSEQANRFLRSVFEEVDIQFNSLNKFTNPVFNVVEEINRSDMVIGIGRSVYDAMACGRPCIIFDNRDYNGNRADGYLRPSKFYDYVKHNCSGRFLNRRYGKAEILREVSKYDPSDGQKLREIAVNDLNADNTVQRLLETAKKIGWKTRLKKWHRLSRNFKQFKRVCLYRKLYRWTKIGYFNKPYL